jgi:crossover junction endodeoxyribonuclease RuvC
MGIIMGIDPGSIVTGYGLVTEIAGELRCLEFGALDGGAKSAHGERLLKIGQGLEKIFRDHKPHAVAIEKTFFAKNADSAIKLGQARGVCLYEAARAKVPIYEYSPTEIKLSVVGNGRADKEQVLFVIGHLLKLKVDALAKFDMSDALALAIHHCRLSSTLNRLRNREITT